MKIKLNGQEREAQEGESILDLCSRENAFIPTLCYHKAFGGQGSCRMCMVEIKEEEHKEPRMVAACTYILNRPVEIITESDRILRIRRTIVMLLTRRAAGSLLMEDLTNAYSAPRLSPIATDPPNCILCNLCVHACEEIGRTAIFSMFRGINKRITTPYDEASDDCIGCGACARICPTQAINLKEKDSTRIIWNKKFELAACERCGKYFAAVDELKYLQQQSQCKHEQLCETCRRKTLAQTVNNYIS